MLSTHKETVDALRIASNALDSIGNGLAGTGPHASEFADFWYALMNAKAACEGLNQGRK